MKRLILVLFLILLSVGTVSAATTLIVNTTAANDGHTLRATSGTSWADIRGGIGTDFSSSATNILADAQTHASINNWSYLHRGVLIFDTSGLPDSAVITGATISLYTQATNTAAGDVGIGITGFTPDGAISGEDYDNYRPDRYATDKNVSTMTAAQYHTWTLNSLGISNISLTGNSNFSLMTQWDIDNSMPWVSGVRTYYGAFSCDYSSCSVPPKITITYDLTPVTAFSGVPTSGVSPVSVTFTDTSTNTPTNWDWYWSADETKDSDLEDPTEIFTTVGTYNVRLYTSNAAGGDWENKTAYVTVTPAAGDIYISSVSSVTNNGATFGIANGQGGNVWIGYGQNPQGQTWKSKNVSAPLGTASVVISGGNILTGTTYYAHACQASGCNTSYESFTTLAAGTITQTNYGAGFDNLTESNFDMFFLLPALMGTYTTVIPLNIFFGLLLGIIVLGMWASNKSTRLVSILFIIAAPLLFTADSGLSIGIPGVMQSLGEACLAVGIAGILLSLIRR